MKRRDRSFCLGLVLGICALGVTKSAEPDRLGVEFFEKNVRPVLVQHCYECHGDQKAKGGLRLDTREGWRKGGDNGPAIVPGNPDESLLIQAVRYGGDYEMPPKGKLPAAVIKILEQWVALGAPDPRLNSAAAKHATTMDIEAGRQHWSYRPVRSPTVPTVLDGSWPRSEVDRFVLSKLEASQLRPSVDCDRIVLIRRVYLDLLGLPPPADEIDDFLRDPRPDAYARLVERLLASPRFGERWGRHWLDVVRFAESLTLRGFVFPEAWRYRDYVITAWNQDRPFDLFIREQIAGDLLPAETRADRERQLIATTFLALGNTNLEEQDKKQLEMDVIDEQLDVISKGFLAQTLTCARCHDHKFDPIPQRDYYAMAGILRNTKVLEHSNVSRWIEAPLPVEPHREELYHRHAAAVAALQGKLQAAKDAVKLASTKTLPSKTEAALVLAPGDLPGIVVDDRQAKRVGEWKESQFTRAYIGDGYLHDLNQDQGQKTLTFVPELPRDGKYEVRFAYAPGKNRATAVKVTVFCADGEKTLAIDETEPPPIDGHFVSLGQFQFERAGQSFVILSNEGTKGFVCADAVQFLPAETAVDVGLKAVVTTPEHPALAPGQLAAAESELKRLETEMKKLTAAAPYRPMAMTVLEQQEISDGRINIRGVVHNLGEQVPRGFLQVCSSGAPIAMPPNQSGRVELAAWLGSRDNPLTARVIVNRIWHSLFGVGIVRTVDNFGLTGEAASHPELLDYLARRFMDHGWSIKETVRAIVLSRTYCQASTKSEPGGPHASESDPENRLLWKVNRRRLDAECLRDAMLTVSGQIRLEMGGMTFPKELTADYGFQHTGNRRSVYEPVFRNSLPEILEAFDFADPSLVTGRRSTSTVAPQALFLMNHPFVLEQSRLAAQRLLDEPAADDGQRIELIFRRTLGRLPNEQEKKASLAFLAQSSSASTSDGKLHAWAQLCQSLFASIDFRYQE